MGTTVNRGYRIPDPGTPPDGLNQIRTLAQDVDTDVALLATGYRLLTTAYYTSSGTFVKANFPGLRAIEVECLGGGGGSGSAAATNAGTRSIGQGGGGGCYARGFYLTSAFGASETVTIGAAGMGGTAGAAGGQGGDTFVTKNGSSSPALIRAGGGLGGNAASNPVASEVTAGAGLPATTAVGADFSVPGDPSPKVSWLPSAFAAETTGAAGAVYGGQTENNSVNSSDNGVVGRNYGSGGAGPWNHISQSARNGAAGSAGLVIIRVYV